MGGVGSQYAGSKPAGSIWPGSAPFLQDLEDLKQGRASSLQSPGVNDGIFHPGEELFAVMSPPG